MRNYFSQKLSIQIWASAYFYFQTDAHYKSLVIGDSLLPCIAPSLLVAAAAKEV